jgi:hypothetical protein
MSRKNKSAWLMWPAMLATLALGVWAGRAGVVSALQADQVRGTVRMQGRLDHGSVEIQVQPQSDRGGAALQVATSSRGAFGFAAQGTLVVTARKPGYLDAQKTVDVAAGESLDLGTTILYGGEVTGDNLIDIGDLAYLGARFGSNDARGDINGDGQVDILDLAMAAANFSMRGPTPWGE